MSETIVFEKIPSSGGSLSEATHWNYKNILVCQNCHRVLIQAQSDKEESPSSDIADEVTCCIYPNYNWEKAFIYKVKNSEEK